MNKFKRELSIDLLRTIGLLCIVLAHVSPPKIVQQIRSFDVPFMVLISGILFRLSNNNNNNFSFKYIYKRFIRLVLPVWVFLLLFFSTLILLSFFKVLKNPYTIKRYYQVMLYGME